MTVPSTDVRIPRPVWLCRSTVVQCTLFEPTHTRTQRVRSGHQYSLDWFWSERLPPGCRVLSHSRIPSLDCQTDVLLSEQVAQLTTVDTGRKAREVLQVGDAPQDRLVGVEDERIQSVVSGECRGRETGDADDDVVASRRVVRILAPFFQASLRRRKRFRLLVTRSDGAVRRTGEPRSRGGQAYPSTSSCSRSSTETVSRSASVTSCTSASATNCRNCSSRSSSLGTVVSLRIPSSWVS